MPQTTTNTPRERALLVGVSLAKISSWEAQDSLEELARLAHTATLEITSKVIQQRQRLNSAYYIGKGKAAELKELAATDQADMIIFDNELSPAQMRNLETLTGIRVLDRSCLILDIFSRHARTRTACLQVELAQLNYLLPRLTHQWSHLSRQANGAIRGMGAAGVRGPGETQLETDRRLVRGRTQALGRQLARIGKQMATSRKSRQDAFKVALVGYTNAGKSTLMRALSGAEVLVEDQLFATLDSTTRAIQLKVDKKILLTDTVGFIQRLPHHLFASFRATLEEAVEADLLLHVVDLSHPNSEAHIETVKGVLKELGLEDSPTLMVYNKIDLVDQEEEERISAAYSAQAHAVGISALSGAGLDQLRQKILYYSSGSEVEMQLQIPQTEGRLLAQLRHQSEIVDEAYQGDQVHLTVRLDSDRAAQLNLERFTAE